MAGDSGRLVAERRQGLGRSLEVAATQAEETIPSQAAHAGREAGSAAGASCAAEVFNRTKEKTDDRDGRPHRMPVILVRSGSRILLLFTSAATGGSDTRNTGTDTEQG
jgi:hypothetical protein